MGIKVLYHKNCYDGFGAAWSAYRRFGDAAEYIAMNYDSPLPPVDESDMVYLLDYCRKSDDLVKLVLSAKNVIVLDHHKTAIPELEKAEIELKQWGGDVIEKFEWTLDVERSGAMLAWQYFFSGEEVPMMINYIQDRDLWQFKLGRTETFHAYMCSLPFDFKVWDNVFIAMNKDITYWTESGENILRYHDVLVEQFCQQINFIDIGGYTDIPIVNCSLLFSEVPHKLLEMFPDAPFAMYFYRRNAVWQYGLRGRGDIDVSAIAKIYGGGGHHDAAGFETVLLFTMAAEKWCCLEHASEDRGMVPELGLGYRAHGTWQGSGVQPQNIEKRKDPYQVPAVEILRRQESVTLTNQGNTTIFIDPAVVGADKSVLVPGGTLDLPIGQEGQVLNRAPLGWVDSEDASS